MPTGYTSTLYEGKSQTFEEFVMDCARAFGALVSLRDSRDAEIPAVFEPNTGYYEERLDEARRKLADLDAMSPETAAQRAQNDFDQAMLKHQAAQRERAARRARYEAMLEEVDAWQPPTLDHVGLKEFMQQQLTESIRTDTTEYSDQVPSLLSPDGWMQRERECYRHDLEYYSKERALEVDRARSRTAWVKTLRESLR